MEVNKKNLIRVDVTTDRILEYLSFIEGVKKGMEHPEWLGDFTEEEIFNILENGGFCFLYRYADIYVASSMLIPAREKDIEKFGLDYDYLKTMDYGPEAVSSTVRGNGIQKYILKDMDEYSRKLGYEHVVTTIHPDNVYSIQNIEDSGFTFVKSRYFSRGKRNIYTKDI